ncbi:unnamed protein product, partial [Ascophyllum nodosum]
NGKRVLQTPCPSRLVHVVCIRLCLSSPGASRITPRIPPPCIGGLCLSDRIQPDWGMLRRTRCVQILRSNFEPRTSVPRTYHHTCRPMSLLVSCNCG